MASSPSTASPSSTKTLLDSTPLPAPVSDKQTDKLKERGHA